MVDVLVHEMVPTHEILGEKEVEELLDRFNVTTVQLPIILDTDPAIKGLEARIGDVVKITRSSPDVGTSFAFRVVTEL
ncbi:DNA-directed RNA polymerase subunit H [archaeon BMS3Abin16]|nr:DNA-directed RNA polymerase subunit H [archaeon BMS3Abin16]GBE56287.1 DNA-directed RNA polymerase subunit H [archaeon BMS3Bbin16]HDY73703.1 DNA-directed RNA polymerase subunit H [Euryarchaeota archaeon]